MHKNQIVANSRKSRCWSWEIFLLFHTFVITADSFLKVLFTMFVKEHLPRSKEINAIVINLFSLPYCSFRFLNRLAFFAVFVIKVRENYCYSLGNEIQFCTRFSYLKKNRCCQCKNLKKLNINGNSLKLCNKFKQYLILYKI